MAQLMDLANEILLYVLGNLWHDDLENFAACCKLFYSLASPTIKVYLPLKRALSTATVGAVYDHPQGRIISTYKFDSSADFIRRAIIGPPSRIVLPKELTHVVGRDLYFAEYVRKAVVGRTRDQPGLRCFTDKRDPMAELLRYGLSAILGAQSANDWLNKFLTTRQYELTELLFLELLPRLERLDIMHDCLEVFEGLVNKYLEACTLDGSECHVSPASAFMLSPVFDRIKEIAIFGRLSATSTSTFRSLFSLAAIPKLHTVRGSGIVSDKGGAVGHQAHGRHGSFQHLHLHNSQIAASELSRLLNTLTPNALKSFTYTASTNTWKSPYVLSQQRLNIDALREHAARSLEYLDYRLCDPKTLANQTSFLGSFVAFTSLKYLKVEPKMLTHLDLEDPTIVDTNNKPPSASTIVRLLPALLETLVLAQRDETECDISALKADIEAKHEPQLPNLKNVEIFWRGDMTRNGRKYGW
ncbi:MAG: hypothetical protein Q9208_005194 [Pyrenodesmia sp. 3 TL-2023]